MRLKTYLLPTMRDTPADAVTASHRLMLRAGLIRQLASGVYTYLPFGYKALRKIEAIIREEMDRAGAQELLMPALHPAELWQQSGRWHDYGPELMRLTDRHDSAFALGATHEEVVTSLVAAEVKTYKRLPLTLYQIQTKFRDERRPRFGVLRAREFLMKDAYSFDSTPEGLDQSYRRMYDAYTAIFTRCGLSFRAVEADSGTIGGSETLEFMALSDIGEDTIAHCPACQYAANIEQAELAPPKNSDICKQDESQAGLTPESVLTPGVRSIAQLSEHLLVTPQSIIKAVVYATDDDRVVLALVRGDYEINEIKLAKLVQTQQLSLLTEEAVISRIRSVPGFIGPVGLEAHALDFTVLADYSVADMNDAVCGANAPDRHLLHVKPGRDFTARYADLRNVADGDPCPRCGATLAFAKGIEVGHVFKLGTKYSERLRAEFTSESGEPRPMIMGCYGIGVSRLLAAVIEQHHDEHGIVWPAAIAPFSIYLHAASAKDETQMKLCETLYRSLQTTGFEVLYDDRDETAGVKFKDAELIGVPIRITVGRKSAERIVECKIRASNETFEKNVDELTDYVLEVLRNE